jgi:hypothetical protein
MAVAVTATAVTKEATMLRSRRFMAVVFVLVLILLGLFLANETGTGIPDQVVAEANAYARYLRVTTKSDVVELRIVTAAQPAGFVSEMSKASYADSVYYGSTYSLRSAAEGALSPRVSGTRPGPFPPLNLWCVYLGPSGKPATTVVFIGEHHDIYNADYILHEAVDADAALAKVGCEPLR